MVILGEA